LAHDRLIKVIIESTFIEKGKSLNDFMGLTQSQEITKVAKTTGSLCIVFGDNGKYDDMASNKETPHKDSE
jgi:hypothetical protein